MTHFFVVPHTHWDREWYQPFREYQVRLAEVIDKILTALEEEVNTWLVESQAEVLQIVGNIAPQTASAKPSA